MRLLVYTAGASDDGRAVRDVIRDEFHLVAHDIARAKYSTPGGIAVNGETCLVNRILREGDRLTVKLLCEMPEKTVPVEGPLDILYEDEDLIALNKPPGIVVHPSHGHFGDTLGNYLAHYFIRKGEPHEIRTTGRLDKDTSGVLVFGKSRTACAILMGQNGPKAMEKEYLALAGGFFEEAEGVIDAPISREYEDKIRRVVRPDGDHAFTSYRVLRQFDGFALVLVKIETGRTHQIRVHMAHIGHDLIGDPIYGDPERPGEIGAADPGRALLHAWRVRFKRPFSDEEVALEAPLPEDMRRVMGI
ncbi:MAG: RluA family pseudouridine synthase [Lachnospiraceae bacterium]|nr:RluA family pseudouridine synthase [Lachnospiraceae bacterium]